MILAIDPGNTHSAYLVYNGLKPTCFGKVQNGWLRDRLIDWRSGFGLFAGAETLVIEMIASYGMPVGREVFETCTWIGRFTEAAGGAQLVYRKDVKLHLCGQSRAKDANIRQALIDKFGGKEKAIGRKATPGPLYGISADVWSALAIAVTYDETHATTEAA